MEVNVGSCKTVRQQRGSNTSNKPSQVVARDLPDTRQRGYPACSEVQQRPGRRGRSRRMSRLIASRAQRFERRRSTEVDRDLSGLRNWMSMLLCAVSIYSKACAHTLVSRDNRRCYAFESLARLLCPEDLEAWRLME